MYKTVVDKITLEIAPLREKKLPVNSIAHNNEISNNLVCDSSGRKIMFGECKRSFIVSGITGLKKMKLTLDYRPMQDTVERMDFIVDIRCIRNGSR